MNIEKKANLKVEKQNTIKKTSSTKIIVLGGGYGGILTAKKLAKKLKKSDVEIMLIDKNSYHTMLTELHEVAAGRVPEDAIKIDFKKVFAGRPVDFILDEITTVDFDNKVVVSKNNKYEYDYLVVGTGSKPTYFGIPGAKEFTKGLWSYDDAVNLREHILQMFRTASIETDLQKRKELLTFIVVGAGFTGVEMIGELGEWKEKLCKDFYIDVEDVNLYVVDMLPKVLPIFPDKLIDKAEKRLIKLGVQIYTGNNITGVESDKILLGNGEKIKAQTIIWAAGVEGSDLANSLETEKNGRGRIVCNENLESVDHKNVYAVGDNVFNIPKTHERPVPQMVENAEHSASLVAKNIVADLKGEEKSVYNPQFHGAMVCIGGRYGVAHLGLPGKFFGLSGFLAMVVKHFINLIYFIQVAGFNKVWTYAMHEVFHVPDRRSLFGGHFSKASPNFWLVPLRIFLGYKWLGEGLLKLPEIIADPSNIFLIPAPVIEGVSGASEWVEEGVEAVVALPVPEFIANMVDWSMNAMFYTPDGGFTALATVFQTGMVIGEVVFGALLIVGLFSAFSSVATIVMGVMIWSSGMAPTEMLWYLAASVALVGGSGSTLGLDYYALPAFKKMWKNVPFIKKWYLYTD
ncbi:MAG: NAD(P)/FAD-dependent oxidoreductase [Acidaminobacteraceae bacterium]